MYHTKIANQIPDFRIWHCHDTCGHEFKRNVILNFRQELTVNGMSRVQVEKLAI